MRSKDTHTHKHFATLMIQTRKDFFIAVLDQFATNGDELLQILDDIESGEVECFLEDWFTLYSLHFSQTLFFFLMTVQTAIAQLRAARNGAEMLSVLDMLAQDSAGFDYIESPMIAQVLGVPTLEAIEFWCYTMRVTIRPSFFLWRNATYLLSQSSPQFFSHLQRFVIAVQTQATQVISQNHAISQSNIHLHKLGEQLYT